MVYNPVIPHCSRLNNFINGNIFQFEKTKIVKIFLLVIGALVSALSALYYFRISRKITIEPSNSPFEKTPNALLDKIYEYLDGSSYLKTSRTKKDWLARISKETRFQVLTRIGSSAAAQLKIPTVSWKNLQENLDKPLEIQKEKFVKYPEATHQGHPLPEWALGITQEICTLASQPDSMQLRVGLTKLYTSSSPRTPTTEHPLHIAARKGFLENVKVLIEYEVPDVLIITPDPIVHEAVGDSALFCAAASGHTEIVRYLLKQGFRVTVDHLGGSIFVQIVAHYCNYAVENSLECLLLLINAWKAEKGHEAALIHADAQRALTLPFKSKLKHRFDIVNLLMGLKISTVKLSSSFLRKVVLKNIKSDDVETIKFLHNKNLVDFLKFQIDFDLFGKCTKFNAKNIENYLIEIGISKDKETQTKEYSSQLLKKRSLQNVISFIYRHISIGDFYDPKTGLRFESLSECLKICQQYRIDLNKLTDDQGNTLFHKAAKGEKHFSFNKDDEKTNVFYQLLECGADPFLSNLAGQTPLLLAKQTLKKTFSEAEGQNLINEMKKKFKKITRSS